MRTGIYINERHAYPQLLPLQVLQRALRAAGCGVCSVATEDDAVQRLVEAGSLKPEAAMRVVPGPGSDASEYEDEILHKIRVQQAHNATMSAELSLDALVDEDNLNCRGKLLRREL